MFAPISGFNPAKRVLRERAKAIRRAAAASRPDAARQAAANFMSRIAVGPGDAVALYHPIADELDPSPLAEALAENGARLALPIVEKRSAPLVFRGFERDAALVKGRHGVFGPSAAAPVVIPSIVVVPLLAFTRSGDRLGYGGGYYDRTLAALRSAGEIVAVGFAYGAQEVDALPAGPLDQKLDWIATEREAFRARGGAAAVSGA